MKKEHTYKTALIWTGNTGEGTKDYKSYHRDHTISVDHKSDILGSSDPAFRGDTTRHNPEDLLVSSLSACHLLSYLHLCAVNGITVVEYSDNAEGIMQETADGGGHFTEVMLRPAVVITDAAQIDKANELHGEAHRLCFIANSCNFPVRHSPTCKAHNN
ncbi:MAG: OsmC family protein [Pyrinomonadaceae bacterium]|nr:OsmC family protein [Pyrinomonadaceae bacterium]MDQ3256778.1 OsmC family protein [Acidobacteriota bacterium]